MLTQFSAGVFGIVNAVDDGADLKWVDTEFSFKTWPKEYNIRFAAAIHAALLWYLNPSSIPSSINSSLPSFVHLFLYSFIYSSLTTIKSVGYHQFHCRTECRSSSA
jgi:hypothetical protein